MKLIPKVSLHKSEMNAFGLLIQSPMIQFYFFRWRLWLDWLEH